MRYILECRQDKPWEVEMGETEHQKYLREQKEATERAEADAARIRAEEDARDADQRRIRDNQTNDRTD